MPIVLYLVHLWVPFVMKLAELFTLMNDQDSDSDNSEVENILKELQKENEKLEVGKKRWKFSLHNSLCINLELIAIL